MPLRDEFERAGNWLFRWRSYLPLLLLVPLVAQLRYFDWPLHSHRAQDAWNFFCISISFAGLAVRATTVGCAAPRTSGRNTREQIADSLNISGMYSVVRHPLYFGNFLMWLGIALVTMDWLLLLVFLLAFWIYYERIMFAEEEFLRGKFGAEFESWAEDTPAFIPRLSQWRRPNTPFSFRKVLRQEYSGFFGIIVAFFLLEIAIDSVVEHRLVVEAAWVAVMCAALLVYLTLRTLNRHTGVLRPNRH